MYGNSEIIRTRGRAKNEKMKSVYVYMCELMTGGMYEYEIDKECCVCLCNR